MFIFEVLNYNNFFVSLFLLSNAAISINQMYHIFDFVLTKNKIYVHRETGDMLIPYTNQQLTCLNNKY